MVEYHIQPHDLMKVKNTLALASPEEHITVAGSRLMVEASEMKVPEATLRCVNATIDKPAWLEDHQKTRDNFQVLVSRNFPEALYVQGMIHFNRKAFQEALTCFRNALRAVELWDTEQSAQQYSTIFAPTVSFPARVLYSMSAVEMQIGNVEHAIEKLRSAALDYDDPQAHRMLAITIRDPGNEEEYEQLLLKAASLGDGIAPIHLATYYWSSQSENARPRNRAMARHWFDIFALEDPNQYSVKVIQAADKHAAPTQAAKDEGLVTLKAVDQELSRFERREKTMKRTDERARALADFTSTWKSIAAQLASQWGSPGFRAADFEWPRDLGYYLPLESLRNYDLNQEIVRLRNVTRAHRKDLG